MKKLSLYVLLGLMFCNISGAIELICINAKDKTNTLKVYKKNNDLWCIETLENDEACKRNSEEKDVIRIAYFIKPGEWKHSPSHNENEFEWGEIVKINRYTGDFEWILSSKFKDKKRSYSTVTGKCLKNKKLF